MADDKKKKLEEALSEIDARLNGLVGSLGATLSEAFDRLDTSEGTDQHRSHEVQTPHGPIRAETGVRVRFAGQDIGGGTGKDNAQQSAPFRPQPRAKPTAAASAKTPEPAAATERSSKIRTEERPRLVALDGHVEADRWIVVGELPGVEIDDIVVEITVQPDGGRLVLHTRGSRSYAGELAAPHHVEPQTPQLSLKNGIVEISCRLTTQSGGA